MSSVSRKDAAGPLVVIETLRSVSDADVGPFKFKLVGILRAHQAGLVWATDIVNTTQTQIVSNL